MVGKGFIGLTESKPDYEEVVSSGGIKTDFKLGLCSIVSGLSFLAKD